MVRIQVNFFIFCLEARFWGIMAQFDNIIINTSVICNEFTKGEIWCHICSEENRTFKNFLLL